MTLPEFWFTLVGFLFCGYFLLEGFDFGVGMLLPVLGRRDDVDRRVMINTIGPVWDMNETWLIVAGASLFAAFPSGTRRCSAASTCRCCSSSPR
jgi:cytochrome d ubiquinol oxidase subunit II